MLRLKFSTVYQVVLTALVLGACFSSLVQNREGIMGMDTALFTPTPFVISLASSPTSQANPHADGTSPESAVGPRVQVQVQVQATGNAKAEGSVKGPGDTNVTANTDGPGNALASASSNLPQAAPLVANGSSLASTAGQATHVTPVESASAPQAIINDALVNLRRGPSTFYDVAGTATRGQAFTMVARTEDYQWWQVCCFNNERLWVSDQVIYVYGAINTLPVVPNPVGLTSTALAETPVAIGPVPTLAPTLPPPTPTPNLLDFDLIAQEQFEETITPRIYLYVYAGAEGIGGYTLSVKKDGVALPVSVTSFGGQPGMTWPLPLPRQLFYNMKLEYKGVVAAGTWELQLIELTGKVAGPPAIFHLGPNEQNQELYVRYQKR